MVGGKMKLSNLIKFYLHARFIQFIKQRYGQKPY